MKATPDNMRKLESRGRRGVSSVCPYHPWNKYSATPGDYFMADPKKPLKCDVDCGDGERCGEPMVLVTEHRTLKLAR